MFKPWYRGRAAVVCPRAASTYAASLRNLALMLRLESAHCHSGCWWANGARVRVHWFKHTRKCARAPRCLAVPLSAPFRHWEGSAVRQQATPSPGSEAIVRITVLFFPPVYWRSTKICISTLIKSARDTVQNESVAQNVHFPDSYHRFMIENVGTILI